VPINDDSAPDHSLPLFLSNDVEEAEQRGSSRLLRMGLLGLTALADGGAALLLGGPVSRITASLIGTSAPAPSPNNDAPASPAQPIIEAQAAPPTEATAPTQAEAPSNPPPAAAAPEPAEPKQADAAVDRDALFRQFQAWAQQHDGKPDQQQTSGQENEAPPTRGVSAHPASPRRAAETTRPVPTRAEPKAVAPAAQAPVRAAQKQRPARELRNARAEVDSERRAKATAAQTYWTPQEEARAPEAPAQSTDTPLLQRLFGGHN